MSLRKQEGYCQSGKNPPKNPPNKPVERTGRTLFVLNIQPDVKAAVGGSVIAKAKTARPSLKSLCFLKDSMPKFMIDKKDFEGEEFNALMASSDGRRLWVTYHDGAHFFKVENLRNNCEVVCKTHSIGKAVRVFNET